MICYFLSIKKQRYPRKLAHYVRNNLHPFKKGYEFVRKGKNI